MEKRTNKAKVTVGVFLLFSTVGLLLLYSIANPSSRVGILATAASAQPGTSITPIAAQPQDPAFIKFDGIDGESQDRDHRDWIDLLSFSQGQYLSPSSSAPGGAATGRLVFEELALRKTLDKACPKLAEAVCKGTVFPNVQLHLTRPSSAGAQATYYTVEMKNVIVTSYHISGSTQEEVPTETFSLNFEEIKVAYTKFDAAGQPEGVVQYGWNVKRNQSL